MRPFYGISSAETVNALARAFYDAIDARRKQSRCVLDDDVLAALEIVRAAVLADLTLTEHENRQR